MTATLKAQLIRLVERSESDPNAVDHLHETLRQTTDRLDRQQVELAIRHAEAKAGRKALGARRGA